MKMEDASLERLTIKQRKIYEYIKNFIKKHGYPPAIREIGQALNLSSSSTVHSHIKNLIKMGYITKDTNKSRTLDIVNKERTMNNTSFASIPLLGKVTAGIPITAVENIEEMYLLPNNLVGNNDENLFMLNVSGESMINIGIMDGDVVIVQKQQTAQNGDIVVAMIDDEDVTIKRFYHEKTHIRLQPENDNMEPIISKNIQILGKVTGLIRTY